MESRTSELRRKTVRGQTVGQAMRPAATTVETDGHLAAAAYLINHANQSALVVVDVTGRPVAIITEADLLRAVAQGAEPSVARVADWMNNHPQVVDTDTTVAEAARIMVEAESRHLPVVSDGRLVGIVGMGDIVDILVHSMRLASVVLSVSDLNRSLSFYEALLRYTVVTSNDDIALLAGPDGSQLYLHQNGERRPRTGDDLECVVWTAGGPDDLDRCRELLSQRGALIRRGTDEGVAVVEGRDPDGTRIMIAFPGSDQVPRDMISTRTERPPEHQRR